MPNSAARTDAEAPARSISTTSKSCDALAGFVPLETGLRASAKLTAVRRLSVPNLDASRAPPASCARSVAGPSQASVSWRPKERFVEAVEVPTPLGGHGLDLRA